MPRSALAALVFLSATSLAAPDLARGQSFKIETFDIKGDGGTGHGSRSARRYGR